MKKASRNLVLRSETLRALAKIDLARAVGGAESGNVQCLVVAAESGAFQCPHALVTTADCK